MAVQWTQEQKAVIDHREGNLLVSAAAGSGKTAVLVERILQMLIDQEDPVSVSDLLIVTFTNAAAAQMRDKLYRGILARLEEEPSNGHLQTQLNLMQYASIMTIHAFCLTVIRDHMTRIQDLDPGFRVADESEAELLKSDVLDAVLEEFYGRSLEEPDTPEAKEFVSFVDCYGGARQDWKIEDIIADSTTFLQGLPDWEAWLDTAVESYQLETEQAIYETGWYRVLKETAKRKLLKARGQYQQAVPLFSAMPDADKAKKGIAVIQTICSQLDVIVSAWEDSRLDELSARLQSIDYGRMNYSAFKEDPDGKERVKALADGAKALIREAAASWTWIWPGEEARQHMAELAYPALKGLARVVKAFDRAYAAAKKEKGILDFHDFERYAMEILLSKSETGYAPSQAAKEYRAKYRYLVIDEYQDSSDVQELILSSIARCDEAGGTSNIFMVGDVKQSIYGFRQARPELFLDKYEAYRETGVPRKIILQQNFRSRREILEGINFIFRALMCRESAQMEYTEMEALYAGLEFPPCEEEGAVIGGQPNVSVLEFPKAEEERQEEDPRTARQRLEVEAAFVAEKIQAMVQPESRYRVWDDTIGHYRRVQRRDIVILLRSVKGVSDIFLQALSQREIGCYTETEASFFQTQEVQLMLNLLQILDNPLQDIPLVGVLYSPIFGFTASELAAIRVEKREALFYDALWEYSQRGQEAALRQKAEAFCQWLGKWRSLAKSLSIHDLLWSLYQDTDYYGYAAAMPQGELRRANLDLLLEKSIEYEKGIFSGLFNFLRFMEKMKKRSQDIEEAKIMGEEEDVVRILSIHKSKGLEYPVVFVCGLGRQFNAQDSRKALLYHRALGIGAQAIDPIHYIRYETPAREGIKEQIRKETLAEEMRVLYVAMTRAKEYLFLTGTSTDQRGREEEKERDWKLSPYEALDAKCYLDWLLPILDHKEGSAIRTVYRAYTKPALEGKEGEEAAEDETVPEEDIQNWDEIFEEKFGWSYPRVWKQKMGVRISVSELKRSYEERQEESVYWTAAVPQSPEEAKGGARRGTAFHDVISKLDLQRLRTEEQIREQLQGLAARGRLSKESLDLVNVRQILRFGHSALCGRIGASEKICREQPFIMAYTVEEVKGLAPEILPPEADDSDTARIMVQGILDCCFLEDGRWVVVDYKTDRSLDGKKLEEYGRQLSLYADALGKISGIAVKEKVLYLVRTGECRNF